MFCFYIFQLQTHDKQEQDDDTTTHDRPDDEAEEPIEHSYDGTTNRLHRTNRPRHHDVHTNEKKGTRGNPCRNQFSVMPRQLYHKLTGIVQSASEETNIVPKQLREEDGGTDKRRSDKTFVMPQQLRVKPNEAAQTGQDRPLVRPQGAKAEFASTVADPRAELQHHSDGPNELNQRPPQAPADKIKH